MNDSAKPTDADLLRQLADAVSRRECSPNYAVDMAYKLGCASGRVEGAQTTTDAIKNVLSARTA